ncbi:tetratricopeptide repeat protein [Candidatus Sumerlaeota bacterium]|nr:tetratricopeptide repeat protein [Candidatus Sumerlaeota bacterium]
MAGKQQFLLLVLFCILLSAAFPDIVVFKSGERKTGMVIEAESDADNIVFLSIAGEMKIPRSRINKITMEPQDQSYVHIGKGYLELKNHASAREYIEKALDLNPDNEDAKALLSVIREEINRELAKNKQEKAFKIDQSLTEISDMIDAQKYENALALIEKYQQADLSAAQKDNLESLHFKLYYQWGLNSLDRLNPKGAGDYFEKALSLQPDNQMVFDKLLSIWDNDPSMTLKVIAIYEKQYKDNPDDVALNRKLADLYYRQRDYKGASPYLKMVHRKTNGLDVINSERLRDSLVNLHSEAAFNKKFDLAAQYYREFLDAFPGEDPTPLYYYQYSQMRQSIADDDYEGRVKLGEFCKQHHLDEEAKTEFFYVLEKDPENSRAQSGIMEYAQRDLSEARLAFDKKDYDATLYIISQIVNQYMKLTDILTAAYELKERTEIEIRRENKELTARAKALAARGDEYFLTAEYHINAMKSTERRSDVRIISDKEEAKKFLQRAISVWEAALKIDPSLARKDTADLTTKITDAKNRLINLTRVIPIPDYYRYRRPSFTSKSSNTAP